MVVLVLLKVSTEQSKVLKAMRACPFLLGLQRQVVSFEADYIADTDVQPGYSWVKGDYEKVHQGY